MIYPELSYEQAIVYPGPCIMRWRMDSSLRFTPVNNGEILWQVKAEVAWRPKMDGFGGRVRPVHASQKLTLVYSVMRTPYMGVGRAVAALQGGIPSVHKQQDYQWWSDRLKARGMRGRLENIIGLWRFYWVWDKHAHEAVKFVKVLAALAFGDYLASPR